MTTEQLKILATLPKVIDALNAFAAEAEQLRAAMARAGMGQPPPQAPAPAQQRLGTFNPPAPVNIPTPERAEYRAGNPPANEEEAVGVNPGSPQHLQDARRQRAQVLRQLRQDPQRQEKLAQFRHDAPETETQSDEVVRTSPLQLGGHNG